MTDYVTTEVKMKQAHFLIGNNSAHDIGLFKSKIEARKSDSYHNIGGEQYGLILVNRVQAHEVMRQLKLKLSQYDNSDCKQ